LASRNLFEKAWQRAFLSESTVIRLLRAAYAPRITMLRLVGALASEARPRVLIYTWYKISSRIRFRLH